MRSFVLIAACSLSLGLPVMAGAQSDSTATSGVNGAVGSATTESESPVTPEISLRQAYLKEFAFLTGQKTELQGRYSSLSKQNADEQNRIETQIARQQNELLALEARVQRFRERLVDAEEAAQADQDESQVLEATLDQARTTLGDYEVVISEESDSETLDGRIRALFVQSNGLLETLSSVRKSSGEFFLDNGEKTQGEILWLGRIAAYGASKQGAGVLAPAGAGQLRIWQSKGSDDARALVSGQTPSPLSIFLFESLTSAVDPDEGETVGEHVDSGGTIAWVIVGLGVLGIFLIILRSILLFLASRGASSMEARLEDLVSRGRLAEAARIAGREQGSAARVAVAVLNGLSRGTQRAEELIEENLLSENRRLERFATTILVIAAVAPLLGLLGTVTGMISTFDVITKFGTGDPKLLSGGISTALVTTELGLVVAIPTLLLGNLLKGWGQRIETEVERLALLMLSTHERTTRTPPSTPESDTVAPESDTVA